MQAWEWIALIVGVLVVGLVVLVAGLKWLMRFMAEYEVDTAQYEYAPHHDYRPVQVAEYPHLDLAFYDEARATLEGEGYVFLGDVADDTVARAKLRPRTVMRFLTSPDRTIVVQLTQLYVEHRLMRWIIRLGAPHTRVITFAVEAEDGRRYVFGYTGFKVYNDQPPEFMVFGLVGTFPTEKVSELFRKNYGEFRQSHPDFVPRVLDGLDGVLASENRANALRARFREAVGIKTRTELARGGLPAEAIEAEVARYREIEARQRGRRDNG